MSILAVAFNEKPSLINFKNLTGAPSKSRLNALPEKRANILIKADSYKYAIKYGASSPT